MTVEELIAECIRGNGSVVIHRCPGGRVAIQAHIAGQYREWSAVPDARGEFYRVDVTSAELAGEFAAFVGIQKSEAERWENCL